MKDRIFTLSPLNASVIIRFPEFSEFSESSAQFRKTPVQHHSQLIPEANRHSIVTYDQLNQSICPAL